MSSSSPTDGLSAYLAENKALKYLRSSSLFPSLSGQCTQPPDIRVLERKVAKGCFSRMITEAL